MNEEVAQTKMKTSQKTREVDNMRKTIMAILLAVLSVALVSVSANAAITGKCSDCHTMHASQDGTATTPNDNLTKFSCIGCHNGGVAAAPNVFGQLAAARTAGGTFNSNIVDAAATDYHKVHNVSDVTWTNPEVELLNTTPGTEAGGFTEPDGAAELTCAGTLGCHGQASGGFKGFHHNSYPNAYRFLRFNDGAGNYTDIKGKGDTTWELGGADAAGHNVYYALTDDNSATRDSISSLCSMCHGDFHGQDDTTDSGTSPWKRHPTEVAIPAAWDAIGAGVTIDYNVTPFGFTGADYTAMTTATAYSATLADNPRVVCVSCHRAHGSDYNDLLRFNYTDVGTLQTAGSGATIGCLACHTGQR